MIEAYEEAYFTGNHPAGFSNYTRQPIALADDPDDHGELFRTQHYKFFQQYRAALEGKLVLELGCAYGFLTEDLRGWGVECSGVDGSAHAIAHANEHCQQQDIRTYLPSLADNAFDTIVGVRLLPCLADGEIEALLPHIQRVAAERIFVVDDLESYPSPAIAEALSDYYNIKTLAQWQALMQGCVVESISDAKWLFK